MKLVLVVTLFGHREEASIDLPFEPTADEQEWLGVELHRRLIEGLLEADPARTRWA